MEVGRAKATAYFSLPGPSLRRVEGKMRTSSARGKVAVIRAPRTTIPFSVCFTTPTGM